MFNDKNPEYWNELAKHDLETVIILLNSDGYPDIIIYHMHQTIEKILKSEIIKSGENIIYIHDLERLYKILIDITNEKESIIDEIIILQSYYLNTRYPQSDYFDKSDLIEAEKVFKNILNYFNWEF